MCFYCDTHDGNFWIAPDPERSGLTIAAGDCGHGFKFAPVLGGIIADAVEGKSNPLLGKFRWRPEVKVGRDERSRAISRKILAAEPDRQYQSPLASDAGSFFGCRFRSVICLIRAESDGLQVATSGSSLKALWTIRR